MSVIPQDPTLFAGTIRFNLDPNSVFSDSELWIALERTYLKAAIMNLENKLEYEVSTGGDNFSVGEKQLLCLTRALLTEAKIILLDEATASLDVSLDRLIHKVIKEVFLDATVIVIAHRLENIYGLDRVLIMDGGKVHSLIICVLYYIMFILNALVWYRVQLKVTDINDKKFCLSIHFSVGGIRPTRSAVK
ncbi:unnamed protein product [Angiostrongylus costaricensis]|uniref:ABC transporter domain-containing protein n=1 Tax=Angiostrongylus costaricensis TaxID=334426 RepID=A0A0R3PT97_ANGCS|nr:unnamed protein product [Angiostrongylus costaricensis]